MSDFKWKVLTPEIMQQYLQDLEEGKAPRVVWYAITPEGYEALADNVAVLKRFIKEQRAIILYYRDNYTEVVIPESEPAKDE